MVEEVVMAVAGGIVEETEELRSGEEVGVC